jgi:uncharacterized membrane protein YfcA
MRALFASPLGFLIGLSLGALGGGGSILAVPALVYAAGQDAKQATTSSLLLVGLASLVGMFGHYRSGRVNVGVGIVFGLVGVGGSLAGSALNRRLDPDVLLLAFAGLVLVAAWRMATGCPTCTRIGEDRELEAAGTHGAGGAATGTLVRPRTRVAVDVRRVVAVALAGTAVGFLTGLFGVGGGFVIVPALTLVLGMSMPVAIGTSLLVIVINTLVALMTRFATTSIDWGITVPFAIAAIAGVLMGSRVADRLDPQRSVRAFAVLLVGVALYTGVRAAIAL